MHDIHDDSILARILVSLWARRRLLAMILLAVTAAAAVVAWVWPKSYTTHATFQLKTKEKSSLPAQLKGLKMLDPLSSENSGVSTVMAIFESRQLAVDMIASFGLMKRYRTKWEHVAVKTFQKNLSVEVFSEGIIHMSFTHPSQDSVKLIADSILSYVDARNRKLSTSKASMEYAFLGEQVDQITADLNRVGDSIVSLLKRYNMADFRSQMELGLDQVASLESELTRLSSQEKLMETDNTGTLTKIRQLRSVIAHLQAKQKRILQGKPVDLGGTKFAFAAPYDSIPGLQKEFHILEAEVKKNEAYLQMLLPRVQEARMSMVENVPTITFIDPTYRPGYKSKPKRLLVIALIVVPAMFLAVVWLIVADLLGSPVYATDPGRQLMRYVRAKAG